MVAQVCFKSQCKTSGDVQGIFHVLGMMNQINHFSLL